MRVTVEAIGCVSSLRAAAENDGWDTEITTIRLLSDNGPESLQGLADFSLEGFCTTSARSMHPVSRRAFGIHGAT